jgi:hypothetical protein
MKIVTIHLDRDRYQFFLPTAEGHSILYDVGGTPMKAIWKPPEVVIERPKHRRGNFFNQRDTYMIVDARAAEALRSIFEEAGELLPLPHKGDMYYVVNVTTVADCIDAEKTHYRTLPSGFHYQITRYEFSPDRLPSTAIFKAPGLASTQIFAIEGRGDPDNEFRAIVEREKLEGLYFNEIWSDES